MVAVRVGGRLLAGLTIVSLVAGCGAGATASPPTPLPTAAPASVPASPSPTSSVPAAPSGTAPSTGLAGLLGAYPPIPREPVPAAVSTKLQEVLETFMKTHRGTADASPGGITAAVFAPGCGTWSGAAGHRVGSQAMTADTQLLVASVSKTATAAAVLKLAEAGRVDLDAPIARYLPADLDVDSNGSTVRQVLQMRSGLGEFDQSDATLGAPILSRPDVAADPVSLLRTMRAPTAAPGGTTEYVDANYVLLGYVIERASGLGLAEALRALVLGDGGLSRIVFQPGQKPQGPLALGIIDPSLHSLPGLQDGMRAALASGYVPALSFASAVSTSGAFAADAATLARWGYLLYGGSVVSDESLAMMTTFATGDVPYGMGTHDLRWPFGETGIGHDGWWMGYLTALETRPATGVTVAVLASDERLQGGFWPVADVLADLVGRCT